MIQIPQSTTRTVMLKLFLTGTTTAATGKTVAVTLSKAGGAFANPSAGATNATEVSSGWYSVALSTTDTATLGDLVVRGTATSCDDTERIFGVVKATNGGMTAIPDTAATTNASLLTSGTGTDQLSVSAGKVLLQATQTGVTIPTVTTLTNLPTAPTDWLTAAAVKADAATKIANAVEAEIIDETDSEKVLTAITNKIASVNPSLGDLTLAAIASQVRTELSTELGRIDVAVSSRMESSPLPPNFAALAIDAGNGTVKATDSNGNDVPAAGDMDTGFQALINSTSSIQDDTAEILSTRLTTSDLDTTATGIIDDLATAHGAGSWATATGFATNAQAVKLLAATYDSVTVDGDELTLSNGATQTVTAGGRVTAP